MAKEKDVEQHRDFAKRLHDLSFKLTDKRFDETKTLKEIERILEILKRKLELNVLR